MSKVGNYGLIILTHVVPNKENLDNSYKRVINGDDKK